ncbi:glycoside hydrolase family 16 protein [Hypoxylon fragiforme]|uniref:glycoside hydrolase family 16 protein n=1 Tax=Hypoxylon fragiforme TaxID=63214 RepID=UPI0020C68324|nr:glycoside hydrolase family 16 protein [Hypoxylon fragiforme]KAI2609594.1 glycoside hydrolase family 16 protein [Hypoxylon fragiforme]
MVATHFQVWSLMLASVSFLAPKSASAQNCHCYLTNGTAPQYLTNTRFFDFRNIANPRVPAAINNRTLAQNAGVTHAYFNSTNFTDTWGISARPDDNGLVYNVWSKNDVYIASNTDSNAGSKTYLDLRTYRHPAANGNFQSSAELESASAAYQYVSMRMYARTRGSSGGVTAMFTYRGGSTADLVQEADLEVLTRDATNIIHYTNQPTIKGGVVQTNGTKKVTTTPAVWSAWQNHRYDWSAGSSNWYLNGKNVATIQYQTPVDPVSLLFNSWSDGGSWSGIMASGQSAEMQIQWIQLIYNNTEEPSRYNHCANVCSFDKGTLPGVAKVITSGP